jgi:MFS family permease
MFLQTRPRKHNMITVGIVALQRYLGLLQDPLPRRFLIAQLLSSIGDWFNFVAVIVIADRLGVENGELAVGTALAIRFVPRLLFQGPAGALADRIRGPGLLVLSQVTMGLIALSLILLHWLPHLWLLYLLVFLLEAAYTVSRPAFMVLLIRVVPPPQRAPANGLIGLGLTAAQFIGAALGGAIYARTTEGVLFAVNASTFFLLAFLIWQVRARIPARREPAPAPVENDAVPLASYRDLTRYTSLLLYLVQQASIVVLIQAATALFVTRATELGRDESTSGLFLSMVGLGLIVGSILGGAGHYDTRRALIIVAVTEVASGVGLVLFGYTDAWALALGALIVTGFASQLSDVAGSTFFQNNLPEAVYGRFFSLFMLALSVGGLIGSFLGPLLRREMSTGASLAILFIPAIVTSVLLAWKNRAAITSSHNATADWEPTT